MPYPQASSLHIDVPKRLVCVKFAQYKGMTHSIELKVTKIENSSSNQPNRIRAEHWLKGFHNINT
jgi:hypothetical protein